MRPDEQQPPAMNAEELAERIDQHLDHGNLVIFQPGWPVSVGPLHVMIELLHQRLILETAPTEGRKPS